MLPEIDDHTPNRMWPVLLLMAVVAVAFLAWPKAEAEQSSATPASSAAPAASTEATAYAARGVPPAAVAPPAEPERPKRGPGSIVQFNPDTAPVVPEGWSKDLYINTYYEALEAGDVARAASMVPADDPSRQLEEFTEKLVGYEADAFAIFQSADTSDTGNGLVFFFTPADGAWNAEWEFAETPRGIVVKDVKYSRPGGTACH